jgi:hypothetical protein
VAVEGSTSSGGSGSSGSSGGSGGGTAWSCAGTPMCGGTASACSCAEVCNGKSYLVQCSFAVAQYACQCQIDGALAGSCTMSSSSCDVTQGCCAAFFAH